ncbi:S1 family peptidase [Tahibacter caeni]|uniref:S1 family peptidase n=1 Tax=Tahibacter caeni TaxID=1453545 RepID=UPI00214931EA|nr:serine protease [Tahibacter caeni]
MPPPARKPAQPHETAADALRSGRWPGAGEWVLPAAVRLLCERIERAPDPLTASQARRAAALLNERLCYELTLRLAGSWNRGPRFDLVLARRQVQALIGLEQLDEAEELINAALTRASAPQQNPDETTRENEKRELLGLRARIAKDRYVREYERGSAAEAEHDQVAEAVLLTQALNYYRALYKADSGAWWPGVNAIALLARQTRERGGGQPPADAVELALSLVGELKHRLERHRAQREQLDDDWRSLSRNGGTPTGLQAAESRWADVDAELPWLLASLSECCLALPGYCREAELWLYRFLLHPRTQPFHLASHARQLREIWQARPDPQSRYCPSRLLTILDRRHSEATRSIVLDAGQAERLQRDGALEKDFSGENQFSLYTLGKMAAACASIGSVSRASDGRARGTGFLLDQRVFWPELPSEPVFVTNAHVISESVDEALRPSEARISFEVAAAALESRRTYRVEKILFHSEPGQLGELLPTCDALDICIVRLSPSPVGMSGLKIAEGMPPRGPYTRAYVVGHPRGRPLQISLHDSRLLDYDELPRLIHYRTPTEPGSSGSPVFDEHWDVIGVHHAGCEHTPRLDCKGTYEANEGIALAALRRQIEQKGSPP